MGALKSFARKLGGAEKQEEPEEQAASKDAGHGVNQELPVMGPKRKGPSRELKALEQPLPEDQNLRKSKRKP